MKDKGYVKISQKRLVPTENGIVLCDFLTAHFTDVLAYDYTARLEDQLDRIARLNALSRRISVPSRMYRPQRSASAVLASGTSAWRPTLNGPLSLAIFSFH